MVVKSWISTKVCPDLSGTIYLHSRTYYWKGFGAFGFLQSAIIIYRATLSSLWFHRQAYLLCEASLCLIG